MNKAEFVELVQGQGGYKTKKEAIKHITEDVKFYKNMQKE